MTKFTPEHLQELRKRAEQQVSHEQSIQSKDFNGDQEALLQELQINRIELELQNEELRDTQDKLEQSRQRYVDLFQNAPVGYLIIDGVGLIKRFNQTFHQMMGLSSGLGTGRPLASFMETEYERAFRARLGAFIKSEAKKTMEVVFISDSHRPVETLMTIQSRESLETQDTRELIITVTDITTQKRNERRIQQLLDEKEVFLKEIHHRVKNNMNSIISLITIEMVMYPDLESTRLLEDIIGRIRSMAHLYNKLLETELYDEVKIDDYLEGLVEQTRKVYPYNGTIMVNTHFESFTIKPQLVFPLGLIINELYCNAIKHAFPDGSNGTIYLEAKEKNGLVTFLYKDNGVGIKESTSEDKESFGHTLLDIMTKKMKGTWTTENSNGVTHRLIFPAL